MEAPGDFTRALEREFGGRLRIRWSKDRNEWQVEQRVGRGQALLPFRVSEIDDDLIRARDGYAYVLAVRNGTRMPCPKCHATISVPALQFSEATCDYCRFKGRYGRYLAAYFPLTDILIEHLKKISPERQPKRRMQMLDAQNDAILAARQREVSNEIESATLDNFNKMFGIPQFGYNAVKPKVA